MSDIKAGDTVYRHFFSEKPHKPIALTVTEVTKDAIFCGPWEFDRATGMEVDEELGWTRANRVTGAANWSMNCGYSANRSWITCK